MRTIIPLHDKQQTADVMYRLSRKFRGDLNNIFLNGRKGTTQLSRLPIVDFYEYLRNVPYKIDTRPVEVVGRPLQIVQRGAMDCKKKSIMMGAYASLHGIPYRFVATSNRPNRRIHHVYPEVFLSGKWVTADATYPHYYFGMEKFTTAKEIL